MPLVILHVTRRPYVTFLIPYAAIALMCVHSIVTAPSREVAQSWSIPLGVMVAFIGYMCIAFMAYRIELHNDQIIEKGWLKKSKIAPAAAIRKVELEIGWGKQRWLWAPTLRPFRRIAIYYADLKEIRYLDISLNHFSKKDVSRLLMALKQIRGDLDIPWN